MVGGSQAAAAATPPNRKFRRRTAVALTCVAAFVVLPVAGLIYEATADSRAKREFTAPGMLVDIGGRRAHLLCIGEGTPIVFFVHSGFGSSLSSSRARQLIAKRTRVCSYDRSGFGWSEPGPDVASTGSLARDLAVLQDRAQLPPPFILVASSIGGLTAELYARRLPDRVAGLVFLDAATSLLLSQREQFEAWVRPAACASGIAARLGIIRLLDPFDMRGAGDDGRRGAAITYNARVWQQMCAMARGLPDTVAEFAQAPPLRADMPLTVLTAATSEESLRPPGISLFLDVDQLQRASLEAHQTFARQSSKGRWAIVPDSTHLIASSQPHRVADEVLALVDSNR